MNRYSAAAVLMVLCASMIYFLAGYGTQARVSARPILVAALVPSVVHLSSPTDAFRYWQGMKLHGRIIVALTGKWQPVPIRTEQLDGVNYPLRLKNLAKGWENKLTDDNFLFVASEVGIARRLITILPEEGYQKRKKISAGNKTFVEQNGTFTLYHEGFAREFSTITSFRPPEEPVLLYIEDSFAPKVPIAEIVRQLGFTGLMIDSIVLSHAPSAPLSAPAESR